MNHNDLKLNGDELRRLLGAANPDAALVLLYLRSGNDPKNAAAELNMCESRVAAAIAMLRQLGLHQEEKQVFVPGQRPNYTEQDVLSTMDSDSAFRSLYGEVQRRLGRVLNTEELKILLAMVRYLGLPEEVVAVLVSYCQEQARQRGRRNPSLRSVEKLAYIWAEQGIDTLEEAAAYIQKENVRNTRLAKLLGRLQIRGRSLTAAEERYARAWLEMGMEDDAISMAYEKTCLNTGGLNWAYMNKILVSWHEAGLHTVAEVREGDRKGGVKPAKRELDAEELAAIQRMMKEA